MENEKLTPEEAVARIEKQIAEKTEGFISKEDLDMLTICDEPEVAVEVVQRWYHGQEIIGEKALGR